ncbi:MAG: tRNA-dihydrouridine synthase family protein [Bacteroidales bacterium]|nr:tRNA-dihydrouridine synthase family protein [Bacteroidales bacterium]
MAPLHGFTDATFRNVYFRHFGGFDEAMAPFISLTHGDKITPIKVRDVLPSINTAVPIIPQILGNEPADFILLCNYLSNELGYKEVNWNLGCPIRGIVHKKRGSGLLPYPQLLKSLLDEIIPNISLDLSIKLRLGSSSADEFPAVIEVLNQFPLKNICIHARIGIQQYDGNVMLDELSEFLPLIKHKVIYNGDIHTLNDYESICYRFPEFDSFMLGRGIFYNPFLAELIKSGSSVLPSNANARFGEFYHELESAEQNNRKFWISKMKEYWKYFASFLNVPEEQMIRLLRCSDSVEWQKLSSAFLGNPNY